MSADQNPTKHPHRAAHNRSVSVGANPSHVNTTNAAVAIKSTSFQCSDKTWEYSNAPADELPNGAKATLRRDILAGNASVTALRQSFQSSGTVRSPMFPPKTMRLGLSAIQMISIGPVIQAPPSPFHEAPRKDETDYNYAINRLVASEKYKVQDSDVAKDIDDVFPDRKVDLDFVVQPMPPIPDDQISYVGTDVPAEDEEKLEDGIPAYLKKQDAYKTKMRLIQLRTLLMRCQVLQSTMNNVERKPWTLSVANQPYTHYPKMRKIAYKARELAERLQSRELQARCEYWLGRGHGGTLDFESAAEHFRLAMKFDVENDKSSNGKPMMRGLRPNEKEDVQFLLEYAEQQEKEWQRRTEVARKTARDLSEESNLPFESCMDWSTCTKPTWIPDSARTLAGVVSTDIAPQVEPVTFSDASCEAQQQQLEALHSAELTRRKLTGAEKSYIYHGCERQTQKQSTSESASERTAKPPVSRSSSKLRSPKLSVPSRASPRGPRNLEDELGDLDQDWDSEEQRSED